MSVSSILSIYSPFLFLCVSSESLIRRHAPTAEPGQHTAHAAPRSASERNTLAHSSRHTRRAIRLRLRSFDSVSHPPPHPLFPLGHCTGPLHCLPPSRLCTVRLLHPPVTRQRQPASSRLPHLSLSPFSVPPPPPAMASASSPAKVGAADKMKAHVDSHMKTKFAHIDEQKEK